MPVVLVHAGATGAEVVVPRQETTTTTVASTKEAPNPILPVGNELWWGLGSFLALVLLMRVWLFPKLKKGMVARNAKIQGDLDDAERILGKPVDRVAVRPTVGEVVRAEVPA